MVLQDVNNSAPEGFSDNPYPDQNDAYAYPSGTRFDASSLPQPIPVIGAFMGFSATAVRFKVESTLKYAERKIGRQLTPTEAQALASHMYQLEQTKSYAAATGAAAGAYRAYSTMSKNKYPFYQPKPEDINPNKFGPMKGPMAPFARHAWRFSLYMLVAGQMSSVIAQLLIAQPQAAMETAKDPKLEQFGNDLKASAAAESARASAHGKELQEKMRERQEAQRQARERNGMGPLPPAIWRKPAPVQKAQKDDMSPTVGDETWGSQAPSSGSWDTYSAQTEQKMPQASPPNNTWNRQNQAPQSSSALPMFDDNDASPTGGMFQDEVSSSSQDQSQASQTQARPGESTWDRLRRGGAPVPGQRPPQHSRQPAWREQSEESRMGDSEKERAQREFDERIERERQGRDFSDESGKKW